MPRVIQQVFPLRQPATQWWQLELRWQPGWSHHSLQARWWELESPQE